MNEDELLLHALQQSDRAAYTALFEKYYPMLCAYAHKFLDLDDSEDIVQDVLFNIWVSRGKITIHGSVSSYLFQSVYHRVLNRVVSPRYKNKVNVEFLERTSQMLCSEDFSHVSELRSMMKRAIDELPENYKGSFVKHRFQNLTYREIAEEEGVSVKTIDYRIQQALKELRIKLKDYLPILCLLLSRFCITIW